jgi:hypothetical protein
MKILDIIQYSMTGLYIFYPVNHPQDGYYNLTPDEFVIKLNENFIGYIDWKLWVDNCEANYWVDAKLDRSYDVYKGWEIGPTFERWFFKKIK